MRRLARTIITVCSFEVESRSWKCHRHKIRTMKPGLAVDEDEIIVGFYGTASNHTRRCNYYTPLDLAWRLVLQRHLHRLIVHDIVCTTLIFIDTPYNRKREKHSERSLEIPVDCQVTQVRRSTCCSTLQYSLETGCLEDVLLYVTLS